MANVFTNAGRNWVADKMREAGIAAAGVLPNRVAWGTGAGTAAVGDTTLFTETTPARATATLSGATTAQTGDTFQAVGTLRRTLARPLPMPACSTPPPPAT